MKSLTLKCIAKRIKISYISDKEEHVILYEVYVQLKLEEISGEKKCMKHNM